MDMVYLYRIDEKYKEVITNRFPDRGINDIKQLVGENVSGLEVEGIVLFSSNCSEFERKNFKKMFPKMKCYIFFVEYAENIIENEEKTQQELNNLIFDETQWIDSLQVPVAKHCNLNCNRCYHFSNLVKYPEYYSIQEYKKDLQSLKALQIHIGEIRFLGGEPLLNNDLFDYIAYSRELYPYSVFKIITNGLLLKKLTHSQCEKINRLNVIVSISLYPPLIPFMRIIEEDLNEFSVKYEVFRTGNHFEKVLLRRQTENGQETADRCWKCVIVYSGKIGRCAAGMFIEDFNKYFNMSYPNNNVQDLDVFVSAAELIAYLDDAVPLCYWCVGDERVESFPWSKSTNITISDYVIEN